MPGRPAPPARRGPPPEAPFPDGGEATGTFLATLFDKRYFILAAGVLSLAVSALYVVLAPPTFESEVVVQLEDKSKTISGLEDAASRVTAADANPGEAEIEILRSRSVIGQVVDELNLTVDVRPRRFPLLGGAVAQHLGGNGPARPPLGLSSYAWGGEEVRVAQVDVPEPLRGKWLGLVAGAARDFKLVGPRGEVLASGTVGRLAASGEEPNHVEILVQQLIARPGTEFRVRKRLRAEVIDELRTKLRVVEGGKKTGIFNVSLAGKSPSRINSILDALARSYVTQNAQHKAEEAGKTLAFIDQQLPRLKANVESAESALNQYQQKKGTVSLTAETERMLNRGVEIERALSDLELQRSDLAGRFAEDHPTLTALRHKREQLRAEKAALASKMRSVPEQEIDSARLMRDVKVASELYTMLLNKAQELSVIKSGTIGNVRILDPATRPYKPSSPKPLLTCALGLLLGLVGAIGSVFVRTSLHGALDDPGQIESLTGLPIYAVIPHSDRQPRARRHAAPAHGERTLLASTFPSDAAVEALRSLRTNLQFALTESSNNVIAIEGPRPSTGKSFVCANFAQVLASAGQRVLLVDGDLRRGHLHAQFGLDRAKGLSDALAGDVSVTAAIQQTRESNLWLLSSGSRRATSSEMLASPRLTQVLDAASQAYDLVLIDTPPVLAVTDAALLGRCAGINILLLRAGEHSSREIAVTLKRLYHAGAPARGIVVNDATIGSSPHGRYAAYGYYQYDYEKMPTSE